jgi:hypothetical protein
LRALLLGRISAVERSDDNQMASATSALATLSPYQPPDGLAPREILAHAREHIDKLTKKHLNLQGKISEVTKYAGTKALTMAGTGVSLAVSAVLGLVNGRFGGDKGYLAPYNVPVDLTSGLIAHVVGYTNVLGEIGSDLVHTVGDAAWGAGAYRWSHDKGVELAAHAAAAKAGTAPPGAPGPGPRGGTTYTVPQK